MASHAGTFRGLPAEEARGYLVISPSISSMPAVAKRRIPLPEAIRAPYLTQGKDDGGIADGSPGGLQSGTTQFESLPSVLPESDATASEGVLKTAAARGSGERVTKGDDVITKDQALMGAMVAFQAVTAALVGLFWWSYTSTVADVSALQGDVRTIMVEAAKASASLEGKVENVGIAVGRRIDSLGMIIGNRIDKLDAENTGQFQLINGRLDDLKEQISKQP